MTDAVKNKSIQFSLFAVLFLLFAALSVSTQLYYLAAIPFLLLLFYVSWQTLHFIFLLLIISLPFSAEYMVTETLGTDFPDELLMVAVAFLALCHWIAGRADLSKKITRHPLLILLLLSYCWAVLSAGFSTEPVISVKFLLAKAWYIGAFVMAPLIVLQEKQMIRRVVGGLVIAMVLAVLITLIRHAQYNYSFAGINKALNPFFRNHVNYSAMLVCIIPIVFVYQRSASSRGKKWLAGIVLIILLLALFLSFGRGAWLALVVGALTAWLIRKRKLVALYIITVAALVATVFWIKSNDRYLQYAHDYKTTIWHEDFREHIVATYQLKDVSTAERFYRWIAGVRMIKDNWLTGYGPNSFYNNYKPYAIPAFKTWVSDNKEHSTVHNYFLLIAIEQGIPGLIIFLLLAGCLLYYAQRVYHSSKDGFYKTTALLAGVILMMILTVNFLSDLIETDKIGSLFFLCLAMLVIADVQEERLKG